MTEVIDTRYRVAFEVNKDVYGRLYQAAEDADLDGENMSSNNYLGSYVRRLLAEPEEVDVPVLGDESITSREYSRSVALHIPESEWQNLREAYEQTELADDPTGRNCKFTNNRFAEFCRLVITSRMDD